MPKHPRSKEEREVMQRLAGTIRLLREQKKWSLREFAEYAGVNHSDVFRLETGSANNPSVFMMNKIAKTFGLTVDELMNFSARECPTCHGAGWVKNT